MACSNAKKKNLCSERLVCERNRAGFTLLLRRRWRGLLAGYTDDLQEGRGRRGQDREDLGSRRRAHPSLHAQKKTMEDYVRAQKKTMEDYVRAHSWLVRASRRWSGRPIREHVRACVPWSGTRAQNPSESRSGEEALRVTHPNEASSGPILRRRDASGGGGRRCGERPEMERGKACSCLRWHYDLCSGPEQPGTPWLASCVDWHGLARPASCPGWHGPLNHAVFSRKLAPISPFIWFEQHYWNFYL